MITNSPPVSRVSAVSGSCHRLFRVGAFLGAAAACSVGLWAQATAPGDPNGDLDNHTVMLNTYVGWR